MNKKNFIIDKKNLYLITLFSAMSGYYIGKFAESMTNYFGKEVTPGFGIIIYGFFLVILFGLLSKLIMD